MELEQQNQFSFFHKVNKKRKIKLRDFIFFGTLFFVGYFCFLTGIHYVKSTEQSQKSSVIKNFDNKELKDFAVKAINDMFTLDKNYNHQAIDASDNYLTDKANSEYGDIVFNNDKIKMLDNSSQTAQADKYSFLLVETSLKNDVYKNVYQINFKETITSKNTKRLVEKTACLNLVEKNLKLKIENIAILKSDEACSLSSFSF